MANDKNPADHKLVQMRVTRAYPRGRTTFGEGAVITVPEYAAKAMEAANPPFGERVKDTSPAPGAAAASSAPARSVTP